MTRKVAILGLGLSGAFAARAAKDLGCDVTIYKVKGPRGVLPIGPVWVYWVPKSIENKISPELIKVSGVGTGDMYSFLQWGTVLSKTSFPETNYTTQGYRPYRVRPLLINGCRVKQLDKSLLPIQIQLIASKNDITIQTFPTYGSKLTKTRRPYKLFYMPSSSTKNYVTYSGFAESPSVRNGVVFGISFFEFGKDEMDSSFMTAIEADGYLGKLLHDIDPTTTPIQHSDTSHSKLFLVGRWAEWDKNRLSHQAYAITKEILEGGK